MPDILLDMVSVSLVSGCYLIILDISLDILNLWTLAWLGWLLVPIAFLCGWQVRKWWWTRKVSREVDEDIAALMGKQ